MNFPEHAIKAPIDIAKLYARIKALLDLHKPASNTTSALYPIPLCDCGVEYPCPTVTTIRDAVEGAHRG